MSSSHELGADNETLERARRLAGQFRSRYEQTARFREDRDLAEALTGIAAPVLSTLAAAAPAPPAVLHDAYAFLGALGRAAAQHGATPGVAVTLIDAIARALEAEGVVLEQERRLELAIVLTEAYCAARDEQSQRALRRSAAEAQVALQLGPRCCAIVLAGEHDEADLGPVLDGFARMLLRDDIRGCLLDLSRLRGGDPELGRALGRLCLHASALGVRTAVLGASPELRADLNTWTEQSPLITFFDEYDRAQKATLEAAGLELRFLRRWTRLFLPAGSGLVR